ncbi:MAG: DUF4163 domain-containing protein [Sphingomonadaceae bacterium]
MSAFLAVVLSGLAATGLAACQQGVDADGGGNDTAKLAANDDGGGGNSASISASASASSDGSRSASSSAVSSPGGVAISKATDLYSFAYSYPGEAVSVPALAKDLDGDARLREQELAADTRTAAADAKANGYPYRPYETAIEWKTVADLPRFLSLSEQIYVFTGGAHGNTGYEASIWDKTTSQDLVPDDFFTSSAALEQAVRQQFCTRLDAERSKRREGAPASPDEYNQCVPVSETTVLLGSSNGQTFNRIGFIAAPYVAGPYAEGSYDITVPVNQAILSAVKPEYRKYFSVMR